MREHTFCIFIVSEFIDWNEADGGMDSERDINAV